MNPLELSPRLDWDPVRVDAVASVTRRTVEPQALGAADVLHVSIPALDLNGGGVVEPASSIESGKLICEGGELLVARLNPRKSRVLIAPADDRLPVLASGEFVPLRLGPDVDPRFAAYLFKSEVVRQYLDSKVRSVTRSHQRVSPEEITKMWLRLPPLDEQRRIADHLDDELAKVDRLVELRRRLLRLLEEREGATVAAQLASMGGVRCLLGRVATIIGGTGFPHAYQGLSEGDLPFVKVSDMYREGASIYVSNAENWISHEVAAELGARIVPEGAVIFPKVGAALLKNPRRLTGRSCVIDNNVMAVVPRSMSPRFLRYSLLRTDFAQLANPGPVPSLNTQQVRELELCAPEREEQEAIADRLDQQLQVHFLLRALVERQIDLLAERRKTLITGAVTGQLDLAADRPAAPAASR